MVFNYEVKSDIHLVFNIYIIMVCYLMLLYLYTKKVIRQLLIIQDTYLSLPSNCLSLASLQILQNARIFLLS